MSDEQPTIESTAGPGVAEHGTTIDDTAVRSAGTPAYDSVAEDDREWEEEPVEDLPRRPRRRLLGVGGNPIALTLLGVLLIACGFIGGVLVQKGQSSSSSSAGGGAAGLASRFAALRGGSGGATSATSTGGASAGGASTGGGGSFGRSAGAGASGAGATAGQVAYLSGNTLYVTTAEGNTVKVTTSPASTVTKTVKADVKGIHPGETVLVTGIAGTNGAISAESIRVGAGTGGGLGALLGGSGRGTAGSSGGGTAGGGSGGPALFGNGG
jgi:hypothetical protein